MYLGSKNQSSKPSKFKHQSSALFVATTLAVMAVSAVTFADNNLDKIKDQIADKAAELATERSKTFLDPYFDHLELGISAGEDRKPQWDLIGLKAYDNNGKENTFFFNQLGINRFDERTTLNLGLGYRALTSDEKWMIGANLFYDHEFPNDHQRAGGGLEVRNSILRLNANVYSGITGYKTDKSGTDSKALDGHDARLEASLPYLPATKLTYKTFKWNGIDGASDNEGYTIGLKGYLLDNLLLEVGQTNFTGASTQRSRNEVSLTYEYRFGSDPAPYFYYISSSAYELTPLRHERYEVVQRENRIIKQKKFGTTVSGV